MLAGEFPGADPASDPLAVRSKIAGVEPAPPRRGDGAIAEVKGLCRLEFVRMPIGRPSFWHGVQREPGSPFGLTIVCEVETDELPGPDHVAAVAAIRRLQPRDAQRVLERIEVRLRQMKTPHVPALKDLVLTGIQLSAKPLIAARHRLDYRIRTLPKLIFMVVFEHGRPVQVHVDRDH